MDNDTATITIRHDVGPIPDNAEGARFKATAGGWTHSGDSIYDALQAAWDLSRNVETTVTVWDFCSTGEFDTTDPVPAWVVGAVYVGD